MSRRLLETGRGSRPGSFGAAEWALLVGRVGGPRGAVATYFIPVVAIVLGVLVLGEQVAPSAVAGTALVVTGAWLTSRPER
jgi:drug/metabolite transporter (DMT)-like permease